MGRADDLDGGLGGRLGRRRRDSRGAGGGVVPAFPALRGRWPGLTRRGHGPRPPLRPIPPVISLILSLILRCGHAGGQAGPPDVPGGAPPPGVIHLRPARGGRPVRVHDGVVVDAHPCVPVAALVGLSHPLGGGHSGLRGLRGLPPGLLLRGGGSLCPRCLSLRYDPPLLREPLEGPRVGRVQVAVLERSPGLEGGHLLRHLGPGPGRGHLRVAGADAADLVLSDLPLPLLPPVKVHGIGGARHPRRRAVGRGGGGEG